MNSPSITPSSVLYSVVMYGIVRLIWLCIRYFTQTAIKEERLVVAVIKKHRKSGHNDHFSICPHAECLPLRHL